VRAQQGFFRFIRKDTIADGERLIRNRSRDKGFNQRHLFEQADHGFASNEKQLDLNGPSYEVICLTPREEGCEIGHAFSPLGPIT
jgi:hypothetical protein